MKWFLIIISIVIVVLLSINITLRKNPQLGSIAIPDSEEWMGVYLKGKKIGYSYSAIKGVAAGYEIENRIKWDLFVMGARQTISAFVEAHTDSNFVLKDFYLDFQSPGDKKKVKGEFAGQRFHLELYANGEWRREERSVSEPPVLPDALEKILVNKGLKPGQKFSLSFFDPITQAVQKVEGEVVGLRPTTFQGKEVYATRIDLTVAGMPTSVWLDSTDEVIKHETSYGMVMIREDRAQALSEINPEEALDLIFLFRVKSDSVIDNPREISHLIVEMQNLDTEDLDLSDDVQRLVSRDPLILELDTRTILLDKSVLIPVKGGEDALKATIYIQCDAPAIISQAKQIAGDEGSAVIVAKRLVEWVYDNLEKKATASLPSATGVLRDRAGDCNEHAVLLAALGRAVGIPTKIYVGLVNLGDAFYYHAWNGMYLGRWVPVDATYGQFPADATHIKLKEGNIEEQVKVLKVVDRLKIKVKKFE
ncbi:MAG TPA: transglutaminase domain-containing protein [bacterium (Candidatus Stahlbacteria)]|nr:transglutaminase domain-containing protein [Candidatus Stahlbacteria bacterium]